MTNQDNNTIAANWRCFVACGIVVLSPFQYGLDFGLIGGLQAMPGFLKIYGHPAPETSLGWNISTVRQQLISSFMTLGAFISAGLAGVIATKLGRKPCLWLSALLCAVANVIMMTTTHIGALYVGRILVGVANGGFMTFSQLYIQESSPAKYRGLFFSFFQFCVSFGTLIGTIVDWATAGRPDRSAYLIPLGIIYVIPMILSIGLLFIPESPRWLILNGRLDDGHKSLLWLRPSGSNIDSEVSEIRTAIQKDAETKSGVGFLEMFNDPVDRRRTLLSVSAVSLQGVPGSMFIIPYKAYFLAIAQVKEPFAMTNVMSTAGLVAIIINAFIVVRYGRRRVLMTTGLILCGICQLIMAVVYDKHLGSVGTGRALVGMSSLYMFFFNGMITSYSWLVAGEIPSQRLRSYTFGTSTAIGFLFSWLVSFTTPYFINPDSLNWGPRYGYIWFPACIIGAGWTFAFLPELKGRTLEEINQMFEARLPARKFRTYQCYPVVEDAEPRTSKEEAEIMVVEDVEKISRSQNEGV
ncbi:hypothetical protein BHE90_011851 [Fusarium euwallaceae]|uniref:Major facilitator superfamily (MFS) profile domain-containing protein n=1 Tax=Fusarium euwallaceae TaxID=1147111 RepID=A0A430LDB5_9HYPO|nr:hypothetical protein BHE90_011851 [Fusarium euwallaceae]